MPQKRTEFQNFDQTMTELMKVPHSEIKTSWTRKRERSKESGRLEDLPLRAALLAGKD